jgi:hypothetical protein
MKSKIFAFSLLIQFLLIACQKENIPIAANIDCTTVTYAGTIEPLIRQSCGGSSCHGTNGRHGDMMSYAKLKPYVNNGQFKREVLDRQTMPEGSNLSSQELGQIQCWLDNGALND